MSPSESQGTAERDAAKKLTSVEPVSFKDFYTGMGFDEHPFSLYTAEKEHERQKELFIEPTYYGPIAENLLRFSSMFLVGERGTGKTALIYNLKHLSEDKNIVVLYQRP